VSPLLIAQLRMVERSARVRRYHTEPLLHQQNVGEHTYGVMWLIMLLTNHQASRNLLLAALEHDSPEHEVGDIPAPTKRLTGMKHTFDALEEGVMSQLQLLGHVITKDEANILKLADCLEGAMFCAFELRRGNRDIVTAFGNYLDYIRKLLNTRDTCPESLDVEETARDMFNYFQEQFDYVFRK
jgi:5'-deoxynucleotidase YfbR-like HD superfamily hydrolase